MSGDGQTLSGKLVRIPAILAYAGLLLGFCNGFTAIAGVVLAYVQRPESRGTVYESHYNNIILVFWTALVVTAVIVAVLIGGALNLIGHFDDALPTGYIVAGIALWIVLAAVGIWCLYRLIRGIVHAIDSKPY